MALHDKVQEKRDRTKQKALDSGQDDKIKELEDQVQKLQSRDESSSGRSRSRSRRRRRRSLDDDMDDDDFDRSAKRSRAMIEREFDENVRRMGQRYAQGDIIAENKLQGQIIALQQSVIEVLQQALLEGRRLTKADIHRLIAAQDSARQGSLDALRDQYNRMLPADPRRRSVQLEYDPPRRQLTLPAPIDSPIDGDFAPVRRVQTQPVLNHSYESPDLDTYCRYAIDLQSDPRRPLHSAFSTSGSQRCPACAVTIPVSTQDTWVFETRVPIPGSHSEEDNSQLVELRTYRTDARLIVKSHNADGELACMLCYRERDLDCICKSVDALIRHIGKVHTRSEFEREIDIYEERR